MSDVRINYLEQQKAVYLTIKNQQIYSLLNGIFLTELLENRIIYADGGSADPPEPSLC